jgi:hypothetical protein
VVDRLRLFLNRPLRDSDRPRLFALAVVAVVVAAGILALVHDRAAAPQRTRAVIAAPAAPAGGALSAPVSTPSPAPTAAGEEGRPPASSAGSRADVAGAKWAARRFLAGYLPYSYGHGRPDHIAAATTELRRRLARQPPRVPARERRLRPRLLLLLSEAVSRGRAQLLALVGDGAQRYTLHLRLARTAGSWTVTDVGA